MGLLDNLFKKKDAPANGAGGEFVLGIEDTFRLKDSNDIVVVGLLKGTVVPHAAAYLHSFSDTDEPITVTTVERIEINHQMVPSATDCQVALMLKNAANANIHIGTVLATRNITAEQVHSAYVNAIGNAYISTRKLNLSREELDAMSMTDMSEAWRLYQYATRQGAISDTQDTQRHKMDRVAEVLCQRILAQDEIHIIYNRHTGEPHMFSQTIDNHDGTYTTTPPEIGIITPAYLPMYKTKFNNEHWGIRSISRGEDGAGITNILGHSFYLNGAAAIQINGPHVGVVAEKLVPKPNYDHLPEIQRPVTNPDLMRWILLIGQMAEPNTDDEKQIFGIYYNFMLQNLTKAMFLVPMKHNNTIPEPDADGMTTMTKDTTVQLATLPGKGERQAVRMYTDWARLKEAMGNDWDGFVQPIESLIDVFDIAINCTEHPGCGCYIDKNAFANAVERSK